MTLADLNILYRRPDLYDVLASQDGTKAEAIRQLVVRYGPQGTRRLLDLGCGTGLDLVELVTSYECVGVDIQEQMVAYGRRVRPHLDLRVGDLRSVRLDDTFDVVTCVGNTLTYLADGSDRRAAFATFAAHAHEATLLVIQTMISPVPPSTNRTTTLSLGEATAEVVTNIEWLPHTDSSIMHRRWRFSSGDEATDRIARCVTRPSDLELLMASAGFELLDITGDPAAAPPSPPRGPSAWVVGRRTMST